MIDIKEAKFLVDMRPREIRVTVAKLRSKPEVKVRVAIA